MYRCGITGVINIFVNKNRRATKRREFLGHGTKTDQWPETRSAPRKTKTKKKYLREIDRKPYNKKERASKVPALFF